MAATYCTYANWSNDESKALLGIGGAPETSALSTNCIATYFPGV